MNVHEYAIRMENDGEAYYSEQARINKYNSIGVVSSLLAEAENSHARLLGEKAEESDCMVPEATTLSGMENVFKNLGSIGSDIRAVTTQLEFYRKALDFEQKSIDFYKGLLGTTADQDERSLYEFLIEQEKCHFALLDDLAEMLRHSEEWAEPAGCSRRTEAY